MRRVSRKRAAYRASGEGRAGLDHMARIKALPCIVCLHHGETQVSKTQAHHLIMGRFSSRKTSDFDCIGLCEGHHLGDFDRSKVAIHREPALWMDKYGSDDSYLDLQSRLISGQYGGV